MQDSWRISDVTLNFGVKWNPFLAMSFPGGDIYNFDLDAFYAGTRSTVIPGAPPGFTYPGDPGFAGKSGVNSRYNIFDPRVGFAGDVGGDGRTSVRGRAASPATSSDGPAPEHVVGGRPPSHGAPAAVVRPRGRLRLTVPVNTPQQSCVCSVRLFSRLRPKPTNSTRVTSRARHLPTALRLGHLHEPHHQPMTPSS